MISDVCKCSRNPIQSEAESESESESNARPLFDVFWDAYPRKEGRGAAKKAFEKIKPSQALLDKMLDAIEMYKQSAQWKKDNGQFIPHPATWLNPGRYEDSVTPTSSGFDMLRELASEYESEAIT
jgi:hypothetical protein